jgi:hypothetical protein
VPECAYGTASVVAPASYDNDDEDGSPPRPPPTAVAARGEEVEVEAGLPLKRVCRPLENDEEVEADLRCCVGAGAPLEDEDTGGGG